ncbi:MAG: 50S ribosomal protein L23 [Gammaproteobacteria bacterium]|nr:50S ribosomal protein L23 [Gammaproteobacteria bacterium]MCF6363910.1 50S ribosomal protein L23 [Gammaproteobacteria bacterium]
MNQERIMKVILAPHITEKASNVGESSNQYVFKVAPDATKPEIKQAVEALFEVEVDAVRVLNTKGKVKGSGARLGRRKDWKKAYVRVKAGQEIDFIGGE